MAKATKKAEGKAAEPKVIQPVTLPAGVKVKRHVTLPSLAIKAAGQTEILTIMDEMRISTIKQKADATKPREPATICTAGKHGTGELVTFIVPAVVKSNLLRDYCKPSGVQELSEVKEHGYVKKTFMISNRGKRNANQRYNDFEISEVEVE